MRMRQAGRQPEKGGCGRARRRGSWVSCPAVAQACSPARLAGHRISCASSAPACSGRPTRRAPVTCLFAGRPATALPRWPGTELTAPALSALQPTTPAQRSRCYAPAHRHAVATAAHGLRARLAGTGLVGPSAPACSALPAGRAPEHRPQPRRQPYRPAARHSRSRCYTWPTGMPLRPAHAASARSGWPGTGLAGSSAPASLRPLPRLVGTGH